MRVYLAGPDVFLPEPLKMAEAKKEICQNYGFEGVFPFDNSLDFTNLNPREVALKIYHCNLKLMNGCDLMIANMTPFRSPSLDAGTAFEIGYMTALKKPIFGYSNDGHLYGERVINKTSETLDDRGMLIEDFEMMDNLMLEGAIITTGGAVVYETVEPQQYYTELRVFEKVVKIAAQTLLNQ
ncbi:nucleoside 2-deoxyribosyltransferase [Capilliphycus salinus ALCB114379]|uniref:nucleoside 2-deoxyribosyltransferase n=1 Tax=Capilliphycus salinus TaxID=2768948 RepID=UPI0039A51133